MTFMISIPTQANTIWNISGPLGDTIRSVKSAWSGSSPLGGIIESYDRQDCRDFMEELIEKKLTGEVEGYAYFLKKFSNKEILEKTSYDLKNEKSPMYTGLGHSYRGHANSYSVEKAVHINRNCKEFMSISEPQVELMVMNYPIYKAGKQTNGLRTETKECRVSTVSLDELSYKIIFCVGDNSAYSTI